MSEETQSPSSEVSHARDLLAQAVEVLEGSINSISDSTPSPSSSGPMLGARAASRLQREGVDLSSFVSGVSSSRSASPSRAFREDSSQVLVL